MAKGLTPEVLARAALGIVDADGADALTMRRLAREMGVDPMAAYRHVPDKATLLDLVVEAVLAEVDLAGLSGDWREQLRAGSHRVLATLGRHPHAAGLLGTRAWTTPGGLAVIEWGLAVLVGNGVPPAEAALLMNGTGLLITALAAAAAEPPTLPRHLDPAAHPTFVAVLAAGAAPRSYESILDLWLDRALPGDG